MRARRAADGMARRARAGLGASAAIRAPRWIPALGLACAAALLAGAAGSLEPPFPVEDPALRAAWVEAERLEREDRFADAAERYERVARALPGEATAWWRAARARYLEGRQLGPEQTAERERLFQATHDLAQRGLEADPRCAECAFYAFVGLSRLADVKGSLWTARHVKQMKALLDRAFELGPTHVDHERNSELANLHYAAGVFYRSVPDTRVSSWTLGVRGDKDLALEHLRRAYETTPTRIDYRVELGALLLCLGEERGRPEWVEEGRRILVGIEDLEDFHPSDRRLREQARVLRERPGAACGYTGEAWDEKAAGG